MALVPAAVPSRVEALVDGPPAASPPPPPRTTESPSSFPSPAPSPVPPVSVLSPVSVSVPVPSPVPCSVPSSVPSPVPSPVLFSVFTTQQSTPTRRSSSVTIAHAVTSTSSHVSLLFHSDVVFARRACPACFSSPWRAARPPQLPPLSVNATPAAAAAAASTDAGDGGDDDDDDDDDVEEEDDDSDDDADADADAEAEADADADADAPPTSDAGTSAGGALGGGSRDRRVASRFRSRATIEASTQVVAAFARAAATTASAFRPLRSLTSAVAWHSYASKRRGSLETARAAYFTTARVSPSSWEIVASLRASLASSGRSSRDALRSARVRLNTPAVAILSR